jgi:hypothetical protein
MKAVQCTKIRAIGEALIKSGYCSLDAQANALGLPRSTTWTILKGCHKSSGLSATVLSRMLASPKLPALVRTELVQYVEEKAAGRYGDSAAKLRKFKMRLDGALAYYETKRAVAGGRRS